MVPKIWDSAYLLPTPSVRKARVRWASTVLTDTNISSAMSRFDRPRPAISATARSRRDSTEVAAARARGPSGAGRYFK